MNKATATGRQLSSLEHSYHEAGSRAGVVFWEWDEIGDRLSYCTEAYARMMGRSKAEIMATSGSSTDQDRLSIHPADRQRYDREVDQAWDEGVGYEVQYRITTPDGEVRHLHEITEFEKDDSGRIIKSLGTIRDLTDKILIKEKLRKALANAQRAERMAGLGYWEWDSIEDRLNYCSEGYASMLGLTREEVMSGYSRSGRYFSLIHSDDKQRYFDAHKHLVDNKEDMDIRYRIVTPGGELRHFHEINEVETDELGKLIRVSGIIQDITDRILIEEELLKTLADSRRAEHLVKLGTYSWDWI